MEWVKTRKTKEHNDIDHNRTYESWLKISTFKVLSETGPVPVNWENCYVAVRFFCGILEGSQQKNWHLRWDTVIKLRAKRNVQWQEDGRSWKPWSRNITKPTLDNQEQNRNYVIKWKCYPIKRHRDSLYAIVAAVEKSKQKVEELKIYCQWQRTLRH